MSNAIGPGPQKVEILSADGKAVDNSNPLPVAATFSGTVGAVDQGTGAAAAAPWSQRLSDGSAFYTAAKTEQLPSALVSGRLSVDVGVSALPSGAAKDATLTSGDALWRLTSDKSNVASVQNTAPTSEYGLVVRNIPSGTQPVSGTVTANVGTTNGLALDSTLAKLTIAQGVSLGSNTQALIGGSVTTAAPTYTTGQISPLSLSTAGLLRVTDPGLPTLGSAGSAASTVLTVQGIASMTALTVQGASSDNSSNSTTKAPVIAGRANAAAQTWTEGNQVPLSTDLAGQLRIIAGGADGTTLTSAATTNVVSGAGIVYKFYWISITTGTLDVYDATSGTSNLFYSTATTTAGSFDFGPLGRKFTTGLRVAVGGTGSIFVGVVYRAGS